MPPRTNPLRLNTLQLRTLVVLQQMVRAYQQPDREGPDGALRVGHLPNPHGTHFHIGDATVELRDCTGLGLPAVFSALMRKGLVTVSEDGMPMLTAEGQGYETGLDGRVLHRQGH